MQGIRYFVLFAVSAILFLGEVKTSNEPPRKLLLGLLEDLTEEVQNQFDSLVGDVE